MTLLVCGVYLGTAYTNGKAPEPREFGGFYQAGNNGTDP